MKRTLGNRDDRARLLLRLRELRQDSPRQWGTMTPHEAVCHLSDSFLAVAGKRAISHVDTLFTRTLLKWIALHGPGRWPPGIRRVRRSIPNSMGPGRLISHGIVSGSSR